MVPSHAAFASDDVDPQSSVAVDEDTEQELTPGNDPAAAGSEHDEIAEPPAPQAATSEADAASAAPGAEAVAGAQVQPGLTWLFPDVPANHQFRVYIDWLAGSGITTGMADGTFAPQRSVTRGAMSAFLYRFDGQVPFSLPNYAVFPDVQANHEFFRSVAWLDAKGIGKGYGDGTFGPASAVNRGSMAAFLYRAAGSPAFTAPTKPSFSDVPASRQFYKEIEWLKTTGITTGVAGTTSYAPDNPVNRGAMAAFLWRFDNRFFAGTAADAQNAAVSEATATPLGGTGLTAAWPAVDGAASYRVEWSRSQQLDLPDPARVAGSAVVAGTGVQITGLRAGVTYYLAVTPLDDAAAPLADTILLSSATAPQPPFTVQQTLNVATFNVVASALGEGTATDWPHRRQAAWDYGNSRRPDVVGLQEAGNVRMHFSTGLRAGAEIPYEDGITQLYYNDLARGWKASDGTPYKIVNADRLFNCVNPWQSSYAPGWDRLCSGANFKNQGASGDTRIAYNPTTVTLMQAGAEALEPYPVNGAGGYAAPRFMAWAVFTQQSSGKEFFFATVHYAENNTATLSRKTLEAINRVNTGKLPVILTGDFAVSQWITDSRNNYSNTITTFTGGGNGYTNLLGHQPDSGVRKNTGMGTTYKGQPNCSSTNGFQTQYRISGGTAGPKCEKAFNAPSYNGPNVDYILTKGISRAPVWETMLTIDGAGKVIGKLPSDHVMLRAEVLL